MERIKGEMRREMMQLCFNKKNYKKDVYHPDL